MTETPSPQQAFLKCPGCARVIGVDVAGIHIVQHGGRTIVGRLLSQRCDKCGAVWQSPDLAALKKLLDDVQPSPITAAMRSALDQADGPAAAAA